jgi:hypothetical protein
MFLYPTRNYPDDAHCSFNSAKRALSQASRRSRRAFGNSIIGALRDDLAATKPDGRDRWGERRKMAAILHAESTLLYATNPP